ncbi:MAG TPA: hypothetical protein VGS97_13990, partial [Actinocrinis sp.]|nr:hypothetical protein [Actinocrinis sp.]
MVGSGLVRLAFDRLLECCRELGLVKVRGKQRTDSTHVIGAVRDLNTRGLADEAVRALVEALATVALHFLAETVDLGQWSTRYGPPLLAWRQPRTAAECDALTFQYGRDGRTLLGAIYAQRGEFAWLRELPQVALLCTVLRQMFLVETDTRGREVIRRRDANKGTSPRVVDTLILDLARSGGSETSADGDEGLLGGVQGRCRGPVRVHFR